MQYMSRCTLPGERIHRKILTESGIDKNVLNYERDSQYGDKMTTFSLLFLQYFLSTRDFLSS